MTFFKKKILFIYLFIYGCVGSSFLCEGFLQLWQVGAPLHHGVRPLTIAASLVVEHRLQTRRLSNCGSQAQLLHGMWDLPGPGLEPVSPALAGGFLTTAPPVKPRKYDFLCDSLYPPFPSPSFNQSLSRKAFATGSAHLPSFTTAVDETHLLDYNTPVIIEYRPFIFRRCVLVAFSDLWPHYVLSPFSVLFLFLPLCGFCSFQLHSFVFTYILKSVDYTVFQILQRMKFLHCFGNASCCFMILRRRKRNVDLNNNVYT